MCDTLRGEPCPEKLKLWIGSAIGFARCCLTTIGLPVMLISGTTLNASAPHWKGQCRLKASSALNRRSAWQSAPALPHISRGSMAY